PLRRPELDPADAGVDQRACVRDDLLRCSGEHELLERGRLTRPQLERRIELADDVEIHLYLRRSVRARPVAVLVDDGYGADDDARAVVAEPAAHQPRHVGIRAAADL